MIAYKYRSGRGTKDDNGKDIFERDIELLSHDTIYIPTIELLNDPAEALFDDSLFNLQMKLFKPFASSGSMERVNESLRDLYNKVRSCGPIMPVVIADMSSFLIQRYFRSRIRR